MKNSSGEGQSKTSQQASLRSVPCSRRSQYMYDDLADYEEAVGYKVNESFRMGFTIARMKWGPVMDSVERQGGKVNFENINRGDDING